MSIFTPVDLSSDRSTVMVAIVVTGYMVYSVTLWFGNYEVNFVGSCESRFKYDVIQYFIVQLCQVTSYEYLH